ncbi:MAG: aryl-sulfate sulfotransferase, partial [Planctomycetes bacterium]|nr:aryl-sulfate sulfotransferase [Planctomycetota bacterium]
GGASIVWEWHAMDHVVQHYDIGLPNYDAPSDRPERIDINFPAGNVAATGDWLHFNGIDYNAELDQIILSSRTFCEVWIIDHGTTTQEAAGSTGGLRGRGGDLLYRWGNPQAYGRGSAADQTLFSQHDCQWIGEGRPGAGNLLIFNNGVNRPAGQYSSADEVVAPLNAGGTYDLLPGMAYGPAAAVTSSTHPNPTTFYSATTSGCQRQPNGNTLLVVGNSGFFIEVDPAGNLVWSYQSTLPAVGPKRTFKGKRYPGVLAGTSYCEPANANSTGQPATLWAVGSTLAGENELSLWVKDLPLSEFGIFLAGTGNGVTPLAGGSAGDLCISVSLGRYNDVSEVFFSGSSGTGSLNVDLTNTPTPSGRFPILAGETWYFQSWYRDTPGSTSNFSNALEITFQ